MCANRIGTISYRGSRRNGAEDELLQIVQQVKATDHAIIEAVFGAGKALLRAKEILGHGDFLPWLKTQFGASVRTAQRYMSVAETFADKYDTVSRLPVAKVYQLASVDPSIRDPLVLRIGAGEPVDIGNEIANARAEKRKQRRIESPEQVAARKKSQARYDKRLAKEEAERQAENTASRERAHTAAAFLHMHLSAEHFAEFVATSLSSLDWQFKEEFFEKLLDLTDKREL